MYIAFDVTCVTDCIWIGAYIITGAKGTSGFLQLHVSATVSATYWQHLQPTLSHVWHCFMLHLLSSETSYLLSLYCRYRIICRLHAYQATTWIVNHRSQYLIKKWQLIYFLRAIKQSFQKLQLFFKLPNYQLLLQYAHRISFCTFSPTPCIPTSAIFTTLNKIVNFIIFVILEIVLSGFQECHFHIATGIPLSLYISSSWLIESWGAWN